LIEYKREKPDPALFDLKGYREVPASQFYH
jgi:hypothetical protein